MSKAGSHISLARCTECDDSKKCFYTQGKCCSQRERFRSCYECPVEEECAVKISCIHYRQIIESILERTQPDIKKLT